MISHGSHPSRLSDVGGVPLVPFSYLILRKLEQWDIAYQQQERRRDLAKEIRTMLKLLRDVGDLHKSQPPFDPRLQKISQERVIRFFASSKSFRKEWKKIGFRTSSEQTDVPIQSQSQKKRNKQELAPAEVRGPSSLGVANHNATNAAMGPIQEAQPLQPVFTSLPILSATPMQATTEGTVEPPSSAATAKKSTRAKGPQVPFSRIRQLAATAAVSIFHKLGLPCAIFGSFACKLYGNNRIPNVSLLSLFPNL